MAFSAGRSHRPDLEGLREFTEWDDREDALFFVGRKREIGNVERLCERAMQHAGVGRRLMGMTSVLQGASGAGKTAILSHLKLRWEERGKRTPATVLLGSG